jgi:hypothetical protein
VNERALAAAAAKFPKARRTTDFRRLFDHHKEFAPTEQARLLRLLIERIDYDGSAGKLVLAWRPRGPQLLAEELEDNHHDAVKN